MAISVTYKSWDDSLIAWCRNKVYFTVNSDDWDTFDFYKIKITVQYKLNGYQDLITRVSGVDSSGNVTFEIQDHLQTICRAISPQSGQSDSRVKVITSDTDENKITHLFQIKIYRIEDGVETLDTTISDVYALDAGLEQDYFSYFNQKSLIDNGYFLTIASHPKFTTHTSEEHLYFYQKTGEILTIKVKILYKNGTNSTYTAYSGQSISANQALIQLKTSYFHLEIETNAVNFDIKGWQVWIENASQVAVSKVFEYRLVAQPSLEKLSFLFQNSFGGYDTVNCLGAFQKSSATSKKTAFKRSGDFNLSFVSERESILGGKANTSWLESGEPKFLLDFLHSKEVYLVESANADSEYIPVIISNTTFKYEEKNNELIGLSFDFQEAFNIESFGNIVVRG